MVSEGLGSRCGPRRSELTKVDEENLEKIGLDVDLNRGCKEVRLYLEVGYGRDGEVEFEWQWYESMVYGFGVQ